MKLDEYRNHIVCRSIKLSFYLRVTLFLHDVDVLSVLAIRQCNY